MSQYPNNQGNPAGAIPVYVTNGPTWGTPLGFDSFGPINTATGVTAPPGTTLMIFIVIGGNARWRDDGVAPTASVGMPVLETLPYQFAGSFAQFKIIGESPGVTFSCSFYGTP